jgi:hypothetical protein
MLRFSLALIAALCTLSAAPQQYQLPPGILPMISPQHNSCGEWIDQRKKDGNPLYPQETIYSNSVRGWLWGFYSGASIYGRRPLAIVQPAAIDAWVDKYCADHPLEDIDRAAVVLVDELAARAKAGR